MAAKRQAPAAGPRYNTLLLFVLMTLTVVYGGYYPFSVFLAGAVLAGLALYTALRTGSLLLPRGPEAWCLGGLFLCGAVTLPFAVSFGMALSGVLRLAVWLLFYVCAGTYTAEERDLMLDAAALEGAALSLIYTAAFLVSRLSGWDANGRVDGPFQYANSWALYQLACLLLLFLRARRRRYDWAAMAVLLAGVLLSGSRGVFLLFALSAAVLAVRYMAREKRTLPVLAALGVLVLVLAAAALLAGGTVLRRLRAISPDTATLLGRLLYIKDGARMLLRHPLGLGRGGYLYQLSLEKHGVYTVRSVHCEYLQASLDYGFPAGGLLAAAVLFALLRRGVPFRARMVILVTALHAAMDFDFEFTAVVFLLLLCMAGGTPRAEVKLRRRAIPAAVCGLLAAGLAYLAVPYYLNLAGYDQAAHALWPADLQIAEDALQHYPTAAEGEAAADRILSGTALSMPAWDCKYYAAAAREDYPAMADAKYHYLRLARYSGQDYESFAALLERAMPAAPAAEAEAYRAMARAAAAQLREVMETTDPLAYRIPVQPEFSFSADVLARLEAIGAGTA